MYNSIQYKNLLLSGKFRAKRIVFDYDGGTVFELANKNRRY